MYINTGILSINPSDGFLTITGASNSSYALTLNAVNNSNTYAPAIALINTSTGATNPNKFMRINPTGALEWLNSAANTVIMSITDAGGLGASGEITAYYSDARLKTNIRPIDCAVDKVMQLNGVYYTANQLANELNGEDMSIQRVGLIAQEVDAVLPEVVRPAPFDVGEGGLSKTGENYKTLQYERIVPLLVESIKELNNKISQLQSEILKLKS